MMSKKQTLIIGNGQSRSPVNLKLLKNKFTTIGCNAICRDFDVDHLVCVDRRMVKEALEHKVQKIYTRQDWIKYFKGLDVQSVPELPYKDSNRWDNPFHWGSGPYAVLLGAELGAETCHLIGFDLQSTTTTVNNIYKGTQNYVDVTHRPVDPKYWIKQNAKVYELFPNIQFIVYNDKDWIMPAEWQFDNVIEKEIKDLTVS